VEVKEEIKQETEDGTIVETETLTRATVKQEQTPIPTTEKASSSTPIKAEHRTQDSPPVKTEQLPTSVKLEKTTRRSIKRERDEDEDTKAEKVEKTASRAKRRRGN
jgi:hypothetical protein